MPSIEYDQNDRLFLWRDNAEYKERASAPGQLRRRFVSICGNTTVMVFVIAAGLVGLFQVSGQNQDLLDADQGGTGIIVHSEMLRVYVPPALVELAKLQARSGEIRAHEDLRRFLDARNQPNLWYVITMRARQAHGNLVDLPFFRQPYDASDLFLELLEVLAAAAEHGLGEPTDLLSNQLVHIMPLELARREMRDVFAEVQRDPDALDVLLRRGDSGRRERPSR